MLHKLVKLRSKISVILAIRIFRLLGTNYGMMKVLDDGRLTGLTSNEELSLFFILGGKHTANKNHVNSIAYDPGLCGQDT